MTARWIGSMMFAAALLPLVTASAQTAPQAAPPTIQTTTRLVVLDVVAADKSGKPVAGLKPSDFVLLEDGIPQTLASFTERDAAKDQPPAAPQTPLPPNTFADHAPVTNDTAMTALVFDTSQLRFADAAYARSEAAAYMKKIQPGSPVCIFALDPWGLRLVQDFTTDAQVLRHAIESKNNEQKLGPGARWAQPVRFDLAVREISRYLSAFPGRRNIIWFYGISQTPNFDVGRPNGLFPDVTTFNEDQMDRVTATLRLNSVALYPVDPRGVVFSWNPQHAFWEQSNIFYQGADAKKAAAMTGGKAFFDNNDIRHVVAEVIASGSHYYTVSYTPSSTAWNGNFRKLEVRLANSVTSTGVRAKDVHLEYRTGYYAQDGAQRPLKNVTWRQLISYSPKGDPNGPGAATPATPLQRAMSFGAVPPFQVLFTAKVSPATETEKLKRKAGLPKDNFLTPGWQHRPFREFQIHYSVNPRGLRFTTAPGGQYSDALQFVILVYDEYGHIANSLVTNTNIAVGLDLLAKIEQTGLSLDRTIAVPSHGTFYLRLGIQDTNSGNIGALEVPVESIKIPSKKDAGKVSTP